MGFTSARESCRREIQGLNYQEELRVKQLQEDKNNSSSKVKLKVKSQSDGNTQFKIAKGQHHKLSQNSPAVGEEKRPDIQKASRNQLKNSAEIKSSVE